MGRYCSPCLPVATENQSLKMRRLEGHSPFLSLMGVVSAAGGGSGGALIRPGCSIRIPLALLPRGHTGQPVEPGVALIMEERRPGSFKIKGDPRGAGQAAPYLWLRIGFCKQWAYGVLVLAQEPAERPGLSQPGQGPGPAAVALLGPAKLWMRPPLAGPPQRKPGLCFPGMAPPPSLAPASLGTKQGAGACSRSKSCSLAAPAAL